MRRIIITAIVLALAVTPLLAANAHAVPPSPNHVVIQTLGRRVVAYNHYGDPNRGHVTASAQGELVDTNGNGLANALRGRGALLESHGVERFRMYSIELQVFFAETWRTVAIDDQDVVSTGQPAYLVNYTPAPAPPSPTSSRPAPSPTSRSAEPPAAAAQAAQAAAMVRRDAMQRVLDLGGQCPATLTRGTNFLVVGDQDFRKFTDGVSSSKMKAAKRLRAAGGDIELISEDVSCACWNRFLANLWQGLLPGHGRRPVTSQARSLPL